VLVAQCLNHYGVHQAQSSTEGRSCLDTGTHMGTVNMMTCFVSFLTFSLDGILNVSEDFTVVLCTDNVRILER
jgi:hypothetical protein